MLFFFKLIGNPRITAGLFFVLVVFSTIPAYSRTVVLDGTLTWWDWTVFGLGVLFFLSLGGLALSHLCGAQLALCGEPGVVPVWAQFFGFLPPPLPSPAATLLPVAEPLIYKPKVRLVPYSCKHCGAGSEVPHVGHPCPYCGEVPSPGKSSAPKKRSLFDDSPKG